MKYKILPIIFLISNILFAQEVQLPNLQLVNNQILNPSLRPSKSLNILLPSFAFDLNNNFSLNETWDDINGTKTINPDKIIAKLVDNNHSAIAWNLGTIGASINFGKWNIQAYHQIKNDLDFNYPKTLAQLAWKGNAQYIGKKVDFGPQLNGSLYHEFVIGAGIELKKISVGVRAKLLSGIGNITTNKSKLELTTSDDTYQLNFKTDYELLTTSFVNIDTAAFLENIKFNLNDAKANNSGFAFDLGLSYKVNEKINIGLSLLDIGSINWTNKAKKYSSNADFQFNGFDLKKIATKDSISFNTKLDTLKNQLHFKEEATSYTTSLPIKIYLNANYQLNEKWNLGALIFYSKPYNSTKTTIGLTANYKLGKIISIGSSFGINENNATNIGWNTILKLGPVQMYGITDNIMAAFAPLSAKSSNGRIGMNLIF